MSFRSPFQFLRNWWWEVLCLLIYFALTGNQLFMSPITGLADNGDFPKVLGPLNICDPNHERDEFNYVYRRYEVADECHWDSGLTSSESLFVLVIRQFADWEGHGTFKITGSGKIHLSILLLALGILLWALHDTAPVYRFGSPPLILLIFSDVAYVSYLNSFFMDAGSMILLLLTVAIATAAILRPRPWLSIAYAIAGLWFVTSKSQHSILAIPLAGVALWFAFRSRRYQAACWVVAGALMLGGLGFMVSRTPADYQAQVLNNLIFYRFAPNASDPAATLTEFGLPASDRQYIGTHSYSPNTPINNETWQREFLQRVSFRKVGTYYLEHPAVILSVLSRGLSIDASWLRPGNQGNYEREEGFPPNAHAHRFDWWSNFRSWLVRVFPAHLAILYLAMLGASMACLFRANFAARWPVYPVVLALTSGGIVEFLLAVLGDCLETSRHLFLFQVITEILIVYCVAAVLGLLAGRIRGVPARG